MYEPRDKWLGKGGRIRRRGIYWLPNLFTTIAFFAGFFLIVQVMNGRFEHPPLGSWLTTKLGWVAAFIYCACAALRLARFNTNIEVVDKRFFQGLPSPAAAALIAGLVWVTLNFQVQGNDIKWLVCIVTLFAALTMVSNIPYYSGKEINLRRRVPFFTILLLVL